MGSLLKLSVVLALFFVSQSFAQNQANHQLCSENNGGCDANANCVQLGGLRTCTCKIGFVGTGLQCSDIMQCSKNNGGCHANANCINILGSVKCNCKPGFSGDGYACTPKDRANKLIGKETTHQPTQTTVQPDQQHLCSTNNGGCDPNANCVQLVGARTCTCKIGFVGTGLQCSEIIECSKNNGGCHVNANCVNILGSVKCNCKPGFSGDGHTCTPKARANKQIGKEATTQQPEQQNLCSSNNGGCDPNANCVQLGGLRTCTCKIGFVGTGLQCSEIIECSKNNGGCHVNANCVNILGSVKCNCKPDFSGDGYTCTPKGRANKQIGKDAAHQQNICSTNNGGCDPNANCVQLAGARTCTCKIGFVGTGLKCSDILDCSRNNGGCHANANCVNILGSVQCTCRPDFSGDGYTCTPKGRANKQIGKDAAHQQNQNLCSTNNGGCDPNANCVQLVGARTCTCKIGFVGTGLQCSEVKETTDQPNQQNQCSANNGGCDPNANCVQLAGARTCTCKIGFVGTGLQCSDIMQCSKNNGGCHANANCINILGSVKCNCKLGFTGDGHMCTPKTG